MFVIFATKPLNDGTKGFRFNFLGQKGLLRKRVWFNRGWKRQRLEGTTAYHMGRLTVYLEHSKTKRPFRHFAG
jgi:hypothetical protein